MDRRILVNGGIPIAELVLEEIDACPGLDRPEACLPKLEEIFADWQAGGAAASLSRPSRRASPFGEGSSRGLCSLPDVRRPTGRAFA